MLTCVSRAGGVLCQFMPMFGVHVRCIPVCALRACNVLCVAVLFGFASLVYNGAVAFSLCIWGAEVCLHAF